MDETIVNVKLADGTEYTYACIHIRDESHYNKMSKKPKWNIEGLNIHVQASQRQVNPLQDLKTQTQGYSCVQELGSNIRSSIDQHTTLSHTD